MKRQVARQILGTLGLAVAVTFAVSAQPRSPQAITSAQNNAAPIRLRGITFVPGRGERPAIPPGLERRNASPSGRGYFIVQFRGPIEEAWKAALVSAGAEVLDYIPEFAVKVRTSVGNAARLAQLPQVVWVGDFHPAYKLAPGFVRGAGAQIYNVRIERGVDLTAVTDEIAATGAQVAQRSAQLLSVVASGAQIESVAHVEDVADIEPYVLRRKHNEFGGSVMRAEVAAAAGYDGSTQTIAISDTGLGGGTAATGHQSIAPERIANIFNWPGGTDFCFQTVVPDGPIDVDTGHGTHVATSALGAGDADNIGRGTAPQSRLVFQAIEDFVIPSFFCQLLLGLQPGYYLAGIPPDVSALFQQSYDAGARVHSNSWGAAANGAYTADSANTDAFVWTHRDLAITISAGNSGVDANADGVVDLGSVNAPGTAKNVITIGASEGDRDANYACDATVGDACQARGGQNDVFTYGAGFGISFRVNPLKDDPSAGNREQMAAFSSRGPTTDGRIKPDVVAPGTWILSGYSDNFQQYYDPAANPQTGRFQYDGWGDPFNDKYKYMGGTSMSAPLVAGAAAVVRDYYEKAHAHEASAALVKATLVNSAVDLLDENNDGVDDNAYPIPNMHEGWGRVDLAAATDGTRQFVDESTALLTGEVWSQMLTVDDSMRPLRVTLAWTDAPGSTAAAKQLVNDLDLVVTAPDGTEYVGNAFIDGWTSPAGTPDRTNNLENVYVAAPAAGEWTISVRAFNIPQGPQPFALVIGREASPVQQMSRVSIEATDATAAEAGLEPGAFTFTRTGDLSNELTVSYVVSGTATAGEDYVALSGSVTFAASSASATVVLTPLNDSLVENAETIVVTVIAGENYGVRLPSSATVTMTSDDQPGDLIVSAISVPTTAVPGESLAVTDTTKNQGSWPVQASQTGFYLSRNTTLDSTDILIGTREVPELGPGSTHAATTMVSFPADASGTYYVIAKADWHEQIPETSETNNRRSSSAVRVGPDLLVSAISGTPVAAPGGTFEVTDTTRNQGSGDAGTFVVGFYLSANSVFGTDDVRVGERTITMLAAGQTNTATTTVTVPANFAAGSYYIFANADDGNVIVEPNETNNERAWTTKLKVGPDLTVSGVSVPTVAGAGRTITFTDNIKNIGGAPAPPSEVVFYLSPNAALEEGTDPEIARRSVPALGVSGSSTASVTATIPGDTAVGPYYVIAYVDVPNTVEEALETNNSVRSVAIKVGPDLTVSAMSAPSSVTAGTAINVNETTKNTGGGEAGESTTAFYLSTNSALDPSDVLLAVRSVPPLDPNGTSTVVTSVTIPSGLAAGTYYLIAQANDASSVTETSTTNNVRKVTVKVKP